MEMNPPPPPVSGGGKWRAGTLAYTPGSLALLFCWLLGGDFAWSIRDRAVPTVMQLLFHKFSSSDTLAGILFSALPSALGLIVGPVIGYRSDRLRTRWGRRIPFLLGSVPFIVLSVSGLALSVPLGDFLHRAFAPHSPSAATWVLILLGTFWTVFEISCVTANAVFSGLVNDVVPQPVIGRFYGLFRAISLAAGILFFFWMMARAESHFAAIFFGIAALYGIGFTLMCLRVKEGGYPPPPPAAPRQSLLAGVGTYLRDSFGHSYYRLYFATVVLASLTSVPINLYSVFYAKSLGMSNGLFGKCIALTYVISLCLAYPLGVLADRFHPIRVTLASLVLYAFAMAWGALFARDASTFAIAFVIHGVLSGVFFTASASLGQRLLPGAKFTELTSAGGALAGIANLGLAPLLGAYLDATHHAYHRTFHLGGVLTLLAIGSGCLLYRRFLALGGPRHYVAPDFDARGGA